MGKTHMRHLTRGKHRASTYVAITGKPTYVTWHVENMWGENTQLPIIVLRPRLPGFTRVLFFDTRRIYTWTCLSSYTCRNLGSGYFGPSILGLSSFLVCRKSSSAYAGTRSVIVAEVTNPRQKLFGRNNWHKFVEVARIFEGKLQGKTNSVEQEAIFFLVLRE
jgi:hypothetical protein